MSTDQHLFYLNVVVLNKDEVVESKVSAKIGSGPLGFGLAKRAATAVAKRAVKDERVGSEVAAGLTAKLPGIIAALGIDLALTQRYVGGPLVVLRCHLKEVDGPALVKKAKGEEAARHFQAMSEAFMALGIDAGTEQVRSTLFSKVRDALMEKLTMVLPEKLLDASGVRVDVVCNDEAAEAEWFFTFLEGLKAQPAATSQPEEVS